MKDRPPFFFWLQVDKVFRIAEAARVSPVVRPASLRYHSRNFWKRCKDEACLIREPLTFRQARTVGQRTARPDRALVEVRQEFRTDDPTGVWLSNLVPKEL